MPDTNSTPPITRRTALGQITAQAAGIAGLSAVVFAQESPAAKSKVVERMPQGSEIWQITSDEVSQSNIYCEVPYCSADSKYFVYQRRNSDSKLNRTEFMLVELGTWKQHRLDVGRGTGGSAISHDGLFYYLKQTDGGLTNLMRADLDSGKIDAVHEFQDGLEIRSLGTVSTDRRYYAGGTKTAQGWDMFDVALIDLETGKQSIIDRDPFILNPHPQFEPGEGRQLMIQHNRGGKYTADGKLERLVGKEGATLYLLSVPDGKRTELQVGSPYTTHCTGHEAWIGNTKEILTSVSARDDFVPEKGNLLGVRAGQPARVVAPGYKFNHVGVSRCGRFFSGDDWQGTFKLIIGSTKTGKTAVVCDSRTVPNRSQNTHPHAYLTPDLKWLIFNSNRDGFPHIYAAGIVEEVLDGLA